MQPTRYILEDDVSPINDKLLGELYRSDPAGLPVLVDTIPVGLRASFAIYCYRRAHLQGVGIAIAETCQEDDLIDLGGLAGSVLFAKSRGVQHVQKLSQRIKVTLATGNFPVAASGVPEEDNDDLE